MKFKPSQKVKHLLSNSKKQKGVFDRSLVQNHSVPSFDTTIHIDANTDADFEITLPSQSGMGTASQSFTNQFDMTTPSRGDNSDSASSSGRYFNSTTRSITPRYTDLKTLTPDHQYHKSSRTLTIEEM